MGQTDRVQILVVEDSPDDGRMTLRALGKLDPAPSVRLVLDGSAALEALLGTNPIRPELLILDLKLPKVHGLQVLRALRSDAKCRFLPVVVLTSSADPSDIAAAQSQDILEYICKPIDYDEYIKKVCDAAAKVLQATVCTV